MSNINEVTDKLEITSSAIKEAFSVSYKCLNGNPRLKNEIVEQWKKYINDFLSFTVEVSENGRNNELSKAITKAFIFGGR